MHAADACAVEVFGSMHITHSLARLAECNAARHKIIAGSSGWKHTDCVPSHVSASRRINFILAIEQQ